jgi:diaminohydroxyphosphoribosylaminopyrimidine deaminase/5-amino-6-(5-phosphoribosylamino)uracil reductase
MTSVTAHDREYMQRAIRLARKGRYTTDPNPNVGCVMVKHGVIIGEGWHQRAGGPHAEIHALTAAGEAAEGATVYVTLEPCSHTGKTPPCADALVEAKVARVVIAMQDPNPLVAGQGIERLNQAGIETHCGLLEQQARELNPGFIKRMESGRPFVRVKLAMSLDGRTAMASGESMWITGDAARRDVQRLRAESSAILTGVGTVLADDPSMNVRLDADELKLETHDRAIRQPLRIVLDSQHRLARSAVGSAMKIFAQPGECIVITGNMVDSKFADSKLADSTLVDRKLAENNSSYPYKIEHCAGDGEQGRIDLQALMALLADRQINLLHVEAGSVLSGALLKHGLVDEIIVYMAPHIMGDEAKGLFHLPGLSTMDERIALNITDTRMVGSDMRFSLKPVSEEV